MEIFDIVDTSGNPTGQTVERTEAHAKGIRHRTAHIWVTRRVNGVLQVLLQKRSLDKDSFPGGLDTSSAGHIQAGDEPLESALRELGEELDIHAAPEDLLPIGTFVVSLQEEFHGKPFLDEEIAFVYVYEKPVDITTLHLQASELDSVEWHDYTEALHATLTNDPKYVIPIDGLRTVGRYYGMKEE